MNNTRNSQHDDNTTTNVQINIDVTKIVKYSCISSVAIVFIIFASKVSKYICKHHHS